MSEEKIEQEEVLDAGVEGASAEHDADENVSTEASHSVDDMHLMLEDMRAKSDEYYEQLVRTKAELENLRKRHERDLESAHKFATEKFVKEMLQVRDSMELGLEAATDEAADVKKLREGTELTLKLLSSVFEKFDVVEINPLNEPFNPELHQALSMQPRDDVPANTVITVVQKGYTLSGRLVRPAMVMVSQAA